MTSPLRLVFLGSDPIALPLLEWLGGPAASLAQIVGVFTQPDRATGRGQRVQANAIKGWAQARGLPVLQPEKLTAEVREQLAALSPDLALVMAYGHILREEFIATPHLGTLNLHTSLLPAFRGASPIQTAVASGVRETGVTLMRIVRRLDAGPVADCERVSVGALDTAVEVEARLAAACVPLVSRCLPRLAAGELAFREQDDAAATYCRKLAREDGVLDFTARAEVLAARINGLQPWPGATLVLDGLPVRVGLADALAESTGAAPGTVVGSDALGLRIATGDGLVRLRRLQRPGGRMLPTPEFLRGFPIATGAILPSVAMPDLLVRR
ncbi:MAG: methionyl-tRNA formyltransferase [Verrucomicrobia bacterium]|nr:methionyl-tRNA formyltransferase [Verrucomicrobiota bacterium]